MRINHLITRVAGAVLLAMAFFSAQPAFASTAPTVGGYVRDGSGQAIEGVWVQMKSLCDPNNCGTMANPGGVQYVRTDGNGKYEFPVWHSSKWNPGMGGDGGTGVYPMETIRLITTGVQSTDKRRLRASENLSTGFGCGQNPMELTVIVPSGWNGEFISDGNTTASIIRVSNRDDTHVAADFVWRVHDALNCPIDPKSFCTQERQEVDGKTWVKANFNWTADNAEQFLFFLRKPGLSIDLDNVQFSIEPPYTGGILSAVQKHIYARTSLRSLDVWLEEGVEYSWELQPGLSSWPAPFNNRWDFEPYKAPWCRGEAVRCGVTNTEVVPLDVQSCVMSIEDPLTYATTFEYSSWGDITPFYNAGQPQIELIFETAELSIKSLIADFFSLANLERQDRADGSTRFRVNVRPIDISEWYSSDGMFMRISPVLLETHLFSNNKSIADFNAVLSENNIITTEDFATLQLSRTNNNVNTYLASGPVNFVCRNPGLSCSQLVNTETDGDRPQSVSIVTTTITADTGTLDVGWVVPDRLNLNATEYEVLLYPASGFATVTDAYAGGSKIVKNVPVGLDTTYSESINIGEVRSLLATVSDGRLAVAVRAKLRTESGEGEYCTWRSISNDLTYATQVNIYQVNNDNSCNGTTPISGSLGSSTLNGTQVVLDGSGRLTSPNPIISYYPGGDTITLEFAEDTDYVCACGSCTESVTPATGSVRMFVMNTLNYSSWWQVMGGLVFSNARMTSQLPLFEDDLNTACAESGICNPFLIRANPPLSQEFESDTAGIAITNETVGATIGGQSILGWMRQAVLKSSAQQAGANHTGDRYNDFVSLVRPPTAVEAEILTSLNSMGEVRSGVRIMRIAPASGTVTINTNLDAPNLKTIVFVDGDLVISGEPNQKIITAPVGSFLSFIVSGDITFDRNVGRPTYNETVLDSEEPVVEGIFLAGNNLAIEGSGEDLKFVGAGTFVGWRDISLNRRVNDTLRDENNRVNDKYPLELFIHRPDFVLNTPDVLKTTKTTWQEVN